MIRENISCYFYQMNEMAPDSKWFQLTQILIFLLMNFMGVCDIYFRKVQVTSIRKECDGIVFHVKIPVGGLLHYELFYGRDDPGAQSGI